MKPSRVQRILAVTMCALLAFSVAFYFPQQQASADTIDNVVSELNKVYTMLNEDPAGKSAVAAAKKNTAALPNNPASAPWPAVFNLLPTTAFGSEFVGEEADAEQAIVNLLRDAAALTYSTDSATLRTELERFKATHQGTVNKILGSDFTTVDELYDFLFVKAKAKAPNALSDLTTDDLESILAGNYTDSVKNWVRGALILADNDFGGKFQKKLSGIDWSINSLVDAKERISEVVNPDLSAEKALLKAYVRSESKFYKDGNLISAVSLFAGGSTPCKLQVLGIAPDSGAGEAINAFLSWKTGNESIAKIEGGSLKAVAAGQTTLTAYKDNENTDWIFKGAVTISAPSGGGGGGGGGGGTPELNVDTYKPAADAQNVALDAVVKVTFKQDIAAVDLTKVGIKDAQNKVVGGVTAAVDGKALVIAHDKFAYNTKYTVSVPKGTVKRTDRTVENSNLEWSFTTAVETLTACAYTDVPENHWAAGVIKELCQKGILDGYPDGTFRPGNDITRAEFVKIMVVALGLAEENPATPIFKDVNPNDWYYGEVEAAAKANLVNGYRNGLFKPDAKITRQEIVVILIRALGKTDEAAANANTKTAFKDDHNIASWARGSVVVAVNEGLIKGYPNGTLGPKKNATRAEVCTLVSCFLTKSQ